MNPFLGFRPFDEYCEHLPRFYKKCADNDIPILAHCAPWGFVAYDVDCYREELSKRIDKSNVRHEMMLREGMSSSKNNALSSCMYCGDEGVVGDKYESQNHFYMNYGHPRNWIPVLEYFPNLRLCLSGFGGNSEWQRAGWFGNGNSDTNESLPTRQWLRCIIKLTAKYENVYADLSGLNIYDDKVRSGLLEMLRLIQDKEHEGFKHLKDKLIFGSGWYLTGLTDVSKGGRSIGDGVPTGHSYGNYCREFKNLFSISDVGCNGALWERVSLINAWNFYGFSEDKFAKIDNELSK
jgi:predicted TIM-barrel fold metal-dependent hydrolase